MTEWEIVLSQIPTDNTPKYVLNGEESAVLQLSGSSSEIAKSIGKSRSYTRRILERLVKNGVFSRKIEKVNFGRPKVVYSVSI